MLPVFDVDLDDEPRSRWRTVVQAYADELRSIAEWQQGLLDCTSVARTSSRRRTGGRKRSRQGRRSGAKAQPRTVEGHMARFAAEEAARLLEAMRSGGGAHAAMAEELAGIAAAAGVELQVLAALSLQYEAYCACTAVVVPVESGGVVLARTLDWELPLLKQLNIDVRVHRGGQLLYVATTWAGYIGILTAQRPGQYAAAVNFRERCSDEPAGCDGLVLPVGLAMRLAFEECASYTEFVERISGVPSMAPFYCLVASATGDGAQITRSEASELARRQLGGDVSHLLQANMDHWDSDPAHDTQESLERLRVAQRALEPALSRGHATESELWDMLWRYPIYEEGITLYCTVMDPAAGAFRSLPGPPPDSARGARVGGAVGSKAARKRRAG